MLNTTPQHKITNDYILAVHIGITAFITTLVSRSEAKNAVLFGLSPARIIMLTAVPIELILLKQFLKKENFIIRTICVLMISSILSLFILASIEKDTNIFRTIISRCKPILLFTALCCGVILYHFRQNTSSTRKIAVLFTAAYLSAAILFGFYGHLAYQTKHILPLIPCVLITIIASLTAAELKTRKIQSDIPASIFIILFSFTVIRMVQIIMGRVNTPSCAYWGELADAFINGKLYLSAPGGFHDLTYHNGHWYVPNPPLPALILIPYALISGSASTINMSIYSALIGAANAGIIYIILKEAVRKGLFPLSEGSIMWLYAALSLGSNHFWLATTGQMWFISQLLVVTFTMLSLLVVLKGKSPFLAGIALGAAILSRPNVFPIFFCLLGLYWQFGKLTFTKKDLKNAFIWCIKCGIPVLISAILLLLYNYLRFGNWFDFGYTTINGAKDIVSAAEKYGMFHLHFVPENAKVMFTLLPRIDTSGARFWFHPYVAGYSMFLMSPYLIYVVFSLRKEPYVIGSWVSVIITLIMLLFYHNTGAEQFGYRYILDAFAPLLLLLGNSLSRKNGFLFKSLVLFSAAEQILGMYWWYIGRV